jgi:hypothetical protein
VATEAELDAQGRARLASRNNRQRPRRSGVARLRDCVPCILSKTQERRVGHGPGDQFNPTRLACLRTHFRARNPRAPKN